MSYVRLSLMEPRKGQEEAVSHLLDEMVMYHETLPGYLTGYRVEQVDGTNRVGRLAVWERESDADHAATLDHDMALRSELNLVIEEDSHSEQSMRAHWAPKP